MLPVHRIVATAWCPNPEGKPFVDHIDSNRRNNQASNLRWVTRQENNSRLHSRRLKSQNHTATNRDDQLILMRKGKRIEIAVNGYACARMIGCSHVLVYNVLSPDHWAKTAKGWSLAWVKTIDALKQLISET